MRETKNSMSSSVEMSLIKKESKNLLNQYLEYAKKSLDEMRQRVDQKLSDEEDFFSYATDVVIESTEEKLNEILSEGNFETLIEFSETTRLDDLQEAQLISGVFDVLSEKDAETVICSYIKSNGLRPKGQLMLVDLHLSKAILSLFKHGTPSHEFLNRLRNASDTKFEKLITVKTVASVLSEISHERAYLALLNQEISPDFLERYADFDNEYFVEKICKLLSSDNCDANKFSKIIGIFENSVIPLDVMIKLHECGIITDFDNRYLEDDYYEDCLYENTPRFVLEDLKRPFI